MRCGHVTSLRGGREGGREEDMKVFGEKKIMNE